MHTLHQIFLCIVYIEILTHCRGRVIDPTANSLESGHGIFCSNVSCRERTSIIAGSIIGGIIALIFLLVSILLCRRRCKGQPRQSNLIFTNAITRQSLNQQLYTATLFKSGIWSSRYCQSGIWCDFHQMTLLFDSQAFKVTGSGSDERGIFTIDGIYSVQTGRMGLIKMYQGNAETRSEYFGLQMIIQLLWNSHTRQFDGKWYIKTKTYRNENKFQLKFTQQQQLCPYNRV